MKKQIKQAKAPIETTIPLLDPVRIYTALELAAMPLSVMNAAIAAQEEYYMLEHTTQMGGASNCSTPFDAGRREAHSSQRKGTYSLQDLKRICCTSNYSPARTTWFSQIGRAIT